MFGSSLTFRNWSPAADSRTKTPTHVNVYDASKTKCDAGLDRPGMILVAMMSGGDYVPEGIPGCGTGIACEAARAGFGRELCHTGEKDPIRLDEWKEKLSNELKTNQSKLFKKKHPAVVIPEEFPRMDILSYYTHPVVSSHDKIEQLKAGIQWDREFDISGLRSFCLDAFDWRYVSGAKHFIRNLSPALLMRMLRMRADETMSDDFDEIAMKESQLIKSIHLRRQHTSTDNTNELRIGFRPHDIVPIDLDAEERDPEIAIGSLGLEEEAEEAEEEPVEPGEELPSPRKKRGAREYDPDSIVKIWIFETYIKVGVPLKVQDWEETQRKIQNQKDAKAVRKEQRPKPNKGSMPKGALNRYTRITKPGARMARSSSPKVVSLTQAVANRKVGNVESVPVIPKENTSHSYKNASNGFRAPPILACSPQTTQREPRDVDMINLLSSSGVTDTVSSPKRPLQRSISDSFTTFDPEETPLERQDPAAETFMTATHTIPRELSAAQPKKSGFRRTKTLPQPSTETASLLDNSIDGFQLSCTAPEDFWEAKAIATASGKGERTRPTFKAPPALVPTTYKSNGESKEAGEVDLLHLTCSPWARNGLRQISVSPASKMKQKPITQFMINSPPTTPSKMGVWHSQYLDRDGFESSGIKNSELPQLLNEGTEVELVDEGVSAIDAVAKKIGPGRMNFKETHQQPLRATNGNSCAWAAWKVHERQRRAIRLRGSTQGEFRMEELDELEEHRRSVTPLDRTSGGGWKRSSVEVIDLTTL